MAGQGLAQAPPVGVNRDIERAFLACPDHERIMTIQALAAACTPWQRHLFLAVLEQSRGNSDVGVEAVRLANDPGAPDRSLLAVLGDRSRSLTVPLGRRFRRSAFRGGALGTQTTCTVCCIRSAGRSRSTSCQSSAERYGPAPTGPKRTACASPSPLPFARTL